MNDLKAETIPTEDEPRAVESPGTELGSIIQDNPLELVQTLEKTAELAPRMIAARNAILVACTYAEDWHTFGKGDKATACLSSAGAERVGVHFGIKVFDVSYKKEEWTDEVGKAYRYVYEGKASMGSRIIHILGIFSTRDKFLGFANDEWRDLKDINENHIRSAAYHIMHGNAVKVMLGLRGVPQAQFEKMMKRTGQDPTKTRRHGYGSGTRGGATGKDADKQKELGELLMDMANAGRVFVVNDKGGHFVETDEFAGADSVAAAKRSCAALTAFMGKDNKLVEGIDSAKKVKGKRLEIALKNAQKMWAEYESQNQE